MALGLLLYFTWRANEALLMLPPLAGMAAALWYCESRGKLPAVEDRPTTLSSDSASSKR
jgi:hypothetical protein